MRAGHRLDIPLERVGFYFSLLRLSCVPCESQALSTCGGHLKGKGFYHFKWADLGVEEIEGRFICHADFTS